MKISLNWLRELVDIGISEEALAEKLTMAGFEVEDIEDRRAWADGVVVGKVTSCDRHPNANKLSVCEVDIGAGGDPLNIVCGAPNVRSGIFVPVATVGTYLPKVDIKIKKAKLRGAPSEGMICSLAELGLTKESEGIHILPGENLQLGSDVRPLLGLDDAILDLATTANRADALSMVGVAREVAALTGATVRLPEVPTPTIAASSPGSSQESGLAIATEDSKACPIYIGTIIEGVEIAPSPEWLQQRLQAAGVRPINNVVDATNYVLLEWGQPLHAFDRDRLRAVTGGDSLTISTRFAKPGESLTTLDGQKRSLEEQNLLITAAAESQNDRPVALAGVMGGEETEVHDETKNILLEAALFDGAAIRRSARAQGLRTEASNRYERGTNPAGLETASRRAIALILELAGGTATTQAIADNRPEQSFRPQSIELHLDRVNQVLGNVKVGDEISTLQPQDMEDALKALECQIEPAAERLWNVTVPPYRSRDLEREIDLIEEIARLYGYDRFCDTLPSQSAFGKLPKEQEAMRKIRAALRAVGLTELMHYSLVKPEGENQVAIANPLFAEYSALRKEMISPLIDAFEENLNQNNGSLNGFDIGRIFWKEGETYRERDTLAGILGGDKSQGRWMRGGRSQPMTWFEAKGLLESAFDRLALSVEYKPFSPEGEPQLLPVEFSQQTLHPGRTASLRLRGKALGIFGQLHPALRKERELPDEIYVFQLDLTILLTALVQSSTPKFAAYSPYPASDRDIAFFAPVEVSVAELERRMAKAGGKLLESVELFDEYRGESVPEGNRSLAFRLTYRTGDRTLTEEDIEPVHQKVRDSLVKQFGVNLRS